MSLRTIAARTAAVAGPRHLVDPTAAHADAQSIDILNGIVRAISSRMVTMHHSGVTLAPAPQT